MRLFAFLWGVISIFLACKRKERPTTSSYTYADFEVQVEADCFILRLREPSLIAEARAMLRDTTLRKIPIGPLRRGDGGFNRCAGRQWGWHVLPDSVSFAEMAIELCDGLPSHVEGDISYWVDTVGRYCPWGARIVREIPQ
ncbi:MAG: hypothetical protein N2170_08845 [Bacteroidia bacterium]|nr:hypothetical protein [Bacteroidia bacterium]